ncbi:MAG TPA: methyltransferase domain-containing protein, partial [Thermoplasmata archaeon]|nr:methyltransferase domain-containing protein [Thermoplasmata archaeon]
MAKVPKRWYEDFFGSDYLIRYVHPETPAQVEAIDKILHVRKGGRILDVACGAGRHTIELAKRGYRVTGFDLSSPLLAEGRKAARKA